MISNIPHALNLREVRKILYMKLGKENSAQPQNGTFMKYEPAQHCGGQSPIR
jgi:hypothetical protein